MRVRVDGALGDDVSRSVCDLLNKGAVLISSLGDSSVGGSMATNDDLIRMALAVYGKENQMKKKATR